MTVELQRVGFSYNRRDRILHDISSSLAEGEFILILGRNGAGKSTMLKLLNGILKPTEGHVIVGGRFTETISTDKLAASVAVTFQNPSDQIFAATVSGEVAFGPLNLRVKNPWTLVQRALELLGLDEVSNSHPYDLPAARRKLLTIASAVAMNSPVLAFDEPSAGLSEPERNILVKALGTLKAERRTVVVVSHDLDLFLPLCTRVFVLHEGKLIFKGSREELILNPSSLRTAGLKLPTVLRLEKLFKQQPSAAR